LNAQKIVSIPIIGVESAEIIRWQKFSFFLVAIPLLMSAWDRLLIPTDTPSAFNFTFIILLLLGVTSNGLISVFYEKFGSMSKRNKIADWLLGLNGVLLLFDGVEKWLQQPRDIVYALTLAGLLLITRSILGSRMQIKRSLTISNKGMKAKRNLFRMVRIPWSKIQQVDLQSDKIKVILKSNKIITIYPDGTPAAEFFAVLQALAEPQSVTIHPA